MFKNLSQFAMWSLNNLQPHCSCWFSSTDFICSRFGFNKQLSAFTISEHVTDVFSVSSSPSVKINEATNPQGPPGDSRLVWMVKTAP